LSKEKGRFSMLTLAGSLVALVTPFNESGEVDYERLKKLIQYHIQHQTDGLVFCGTTGESCTLSQEEIIAITSFVVKEVRGRLLVIIGTGSPSTRDSLALTTKVAEMGADAALVITPYYNKPTPEGVFQHFKALSKVGLPLVLYHHPMRTGVSLSLETILRIAELPNVEAIKDVSGDFSLMQDVVSKSSLTLLGGEDPLYLSYLAYGAKGTINVSGNVIPGTWKKIQNLFQKGQVEESRLLFLKQKNFIEAILGENNPQGVKYAMEIAGLSPYSVRLPLTSPSRESCNKIEEAIESLLIDEADSPPLLGV
jgi:4-hydroxy-tetrahydrodipicolinate synthase